MASAKFARDYSPPGALATLTGITGGAHNGLGKGLGGLLGGFIIEMTKNTKMAFWYFGLFAFGCGAVYGVIVNVMRFLVREPPRPLAQDMTLENSRVESEIPENTDPLLSKHVTAESSDEEKK